MLKSSSVLGGTQKFEKLLDPYFGDYYLPCYWESDKKSKNWFARINPGNGKFMFNRKFIRNCKLIIINCIELLIYFECYRIINYF